MAVLTRELFVTKRNRFGRARSEVAANFDVSCREQRLRNYCRSDRRVSGARYPLKCQACLSTRQSQVAERHELEGHSIWHIWRSSRILAPDQRYRKGNNPNWKTPEQRRLMFLASGRREAKNICPSDRATTKRHF